MAIYTAEELMKMTGAKEIKSVKTNNQEIIEPEEPQISVDFIQGVVGIIFWVVVLIILIKIFKKHSIKIKNIFHSQKLKNILIFVVGASLLILLLIGLFNLFKKDEWTGYFYPDASNLSDWIESNYIFDSIEDCREWVSGQAEDQFIKTRNNQYDYECGLNCKNKNGMNVCEETLN